MPFVYPIARLLHCSLSHSIQFAITFFGSLVYYICIDFITECMYPFMHVPLFKRSILNCIHSASSLFHTFDWIAYTASQYYLTFSKCKMTMRHTVVWRCFRFRIKSIKWFISIFLLFVWKVQFDSLLTVGAGFEFMCGLNRNKITIATGFGLWMRLSNSMCLCVIYGSISFDAQFECLFISSLGTRYSVLCRNEKRHYENVHMNLPLYLY